MHYDSTLQVNKALVGINVHNMMGSNRLHTQCGAEHRRAITGPSDSGLPRQVAKSWLDWLIMTRRGKMFRNSRHHVESGWPSADGRASVLR